MTLGDRIRERLEALDVSGAELARRVGVAQPTISSLMTGKSRSTLHLHAIARALRTTPEYLLGETDQAGFEASDPRRELGEIAEAARKQANDTVYVHHIDLSFGLGSAIMDTEIVESQAEMMAFPQSWLRMITTSPASMLYWARGQGNSMEPAIRDGDVILIDRSQRDLRFGDLYWAIAYGDIGMIKRLRQMPDGSVKILSDNPSVATEIAYDGELSVFGRVVAVVHRL